MTKQRNLQVERLARQWYYGDTPMMICLITALTLGLLLVACGAPSSVPAEVVVQTALPTPTLESTFTPAPPPTNTPRPSPTATPAEPTPTPTPQTALSGRILDRDTNQPIAGAKASAGSYSVVTDADGRYILTDLPPGQYVLSVTHPDYDPGLSSIFTLAAGENQSLNLALYAPDTSPYPKDPMLTNPLDPSGAPTAEDAERLAHLQGLTGEAVNIRETVLSGEYLVNYKIGDDVRAAVAELNHEVWELTDDAGRAWWIIKVCGNLASPLPAQVAVATPQPRPLPPMAEVLVDELIVKECASEECADVGIVQRGARVEVIGCLADGGWCQVGLPGGGSGWCTGRSLRQLAIAQAVPTVEAVLPTSMPGVVTVGGGKIAFMSLRDGNPEIYMMDADGNSLTRLTNHPAQDSYPAWSPNGQRIAFTSNRDGSPEIYVMNADGTGVTRLTNHPAQDSYPAWSPDGQRIAFTSDRDGNDEIYVMNADGTGVTRLTDRPNSEDVDPDWSPDGQRIVFSSWTKAAESGKASTYVIPSIYVMNADGSGITSLPPVGSEPDWSPVGQEIVFKELHFKVIFSAEIEQSLSVMNADGSEIISLTDHGDVPAWSPDGRQIVFQSFRSGNSEIYVMNADGSGMRRLTNHPAEDGTPAWSR
jgi:Tol biopolymer transport system component